MFKDFSAALEFVQQNQIEMIDLKYGGMWGGMHHITLPASQFNEDVLTSGIGFDGSSVGLKSVKAGDMVLVPDLSTAFVDPFWEVPTLSFLCKVLEADTKNIYLNDPRNVAFRAIEFMKQTGIADESRWGPEFEFYVFDEVAYEYGINRSGYQLESIEADWNSAEGGHGHYIPRHGGYHAIPPKDQFFGLRTQICQTLEQIGIPVKYHHHEVGGPGQMEIETPLMNLMQAGDATLLIKYVTKMTAFGQGQSATFMPKPLYGEAGSGMHFHQHLFKEGANVFYDSEGYGKISETGMYYIGGLLKHGSALLAFTNPSTNSYRRLVPGYEAPVNAFFSLGNRSAAIRIPKYADQPDTARIEFRPPDGTCNPYLALAAQLMAGLDGIINKIDPRKEGYGPIDEDVFQWTEEQRKIIKPLPSSLLEAMQALEKDHDFLLKGNAFDEELIEQWIEYKLEQEYYAVRNRPHPYEMSLYYDV